MYKKLKPSHNNVASLFEMFPFIIAAIWNKQIQPISNNINTSV